MLFDPDLTADGGTKRQTVLAAFSSSFGIIRDFRLKNLLVCLL